jgi:glutamate dehydrogenase
VLRPDGDDPYLVVAADKGTATFSDIANGIALQRGFWLGDAFASGGSVGYDHKKMGITARGAWEAVKRHFREMGKDIQATDFSVVGVGDMSGDVFGNGMLLSKHIRLVAAFDHRHIFLDPQADAAAGFAERERLFNLPRSSWDDYNKALIGKGGGVFARSLKEIPLTPEVKALIGATADSLPPAGLINALLKAQVDLLWFGGIGTYIKASSQSHLDVGDRANDGLRIDGGEVRAKVVGEGANLGVTQLGRIEAARAGARIDTDAVDNSAGVDTSDHEVNLKILLGGPVMRGELSLDGRNALLVSMTEDVAQHVLADNYNQTLALSVAQDRAPRDLDAHARLMHDLEARGKLDRAVEFLPSDAQLKALTKEGKGLTRPELCVLLAYAKLDLDAEVLASTLPDDPFFAGLLAGYFPPAAVAAYPEEPGRHRLKREIVSTVLINAIVNLAGPVFVLRSREVTGLSAAEVARGFVLSDGAVGLSALKARIDALDGKTDAGVQIELYGGIADQFRRATRWFLANESLDAPMAETVLGYRARLEALRESYNLSKSDLARIEGTLQTYPCGPSPRLDVAALPGPGPGRRAVGARDRQDARPGGRMLCGAGQRDRAGPLAVHGGEIFPSGTLGSPGAAPPDGWAVAFAARHHSALTHERHRRAGLDQVARHGAGAHAELPSNLGRKRRPQRGEIDAGVQPDSEFGLICSNFLRRKFCRKLLHRKDITGVSLGGITSLVRRAGRVARPVQQGRVGCHGAAWRRLGFGKSRTVGGRRRI